MNSARRKQKQVTKDTLVMVNHETDERFTAEMERETTDEQAEMRAVVDKLATAFHRTVEFYKACGETQESAQALVDGDRSEERREKIRSQPTREISWYDIATLADGNMAEAMEVWGRIRSAAIDELESGMLGADTIAAGDPFQRARFLAIRDKFFDGWLPQNSIECAMIEMLAETFSLFQYWTAIAHERAVNNHDAQKKDLRRFESNGWRSPYQSEAEAVEQAHRLADGYNRQFLRVLRQLRDLRRYVPPVIINQGGQVNVANQQLNVAQNQG